MSHYYPAKLPPKNLTVLYRFYVPRFSQSRAKLHTLRKHSLSTNKLRSLQLPRSCSLAWPYPTVWPQETTQLLVNY